MSHKHEVLRYLRLSNLDIIAFDRDRRRLLIDVFANMVVGVQTNWLFVGAHSSMLLITVTPPKT